MRPAYERYKPSGIPWAPEIPAEWKSEPFFAVAKPNKVKNTSIAERNLLSLSYGRVVRKNIDTTFGLLPESFETYQIVDTGHIVFRLTDLQNDKVSLRSALVTEKGIITSAYLAVKFSSLDPKYADYLMRSYDKSAVFYELGGGVRQSAKYDDLKWMPVLTPPMLEQKSIAAFLDEKTAAIDDLIAKKEKLLELLAEKRTALITQAVTKGLDPTAPMKPSGVDWLGDVPKGWDIAPLHFFVKTTKGFAFSSADFDDAGIRVVKASDIKQRTIRKSNIFLPHKFLQTHSKVALKSGDIVVSTVGSHPSVKNSAVGQIGVVPKNFGNSLLNQNTVILKPNNSVLSDFFVQILSSTAYREHLDLHAHGTANQCSLNIADMLAFKAAMPSIEEQQKISSYLNGALLDIDEIFQKTMSAIRLLEEYRTAVITNAVTGKIKVS